ncbi:hypothetical protein SAMN05216388_1001259 [Halorientalis persicus]|uniref:Sulfatase n=1 Tax=Halorientalis persicus TaxID=1367881 RepID=A0A1H8DE03_9EURY|nr:hypothetical protein [Halorientalis persicus]SEN05493.1 hypothetical protein SAMN05216388_1001259 [Halorientalis persicus]
MPDVVLLTVDSVRRDFVDAIADHEVLTDVTAGHYTRPSLAAVQSSRLRASVQSRVVGPTIVEAFSDAGYTTIGLVPTAQADPAFGFDSGFDHYDNYLSESGNAASNRRSGLREYLGSYDIVRQVYRRVYPMEATRDDLSAVRGTTHLTVLTKSGSHTYVGDSAALPGHWPRQSDADGGAGGRRPPDLPLGVQTLPA